MFDECIFCKIARGEASATVEGESEQVIAFRSIDPVAEHHVLIIPKHHIANFGDIAKEDSETIVEMIEMIQRLVSDLDIQDGYKIMVNGGSYQVVPHLHWHLLAGKLEDKAALSEI